MIGLRQKPVAMPFLSSYIEGQVLFASKMEKLNNDVSVTVFVGML